MILIESCQNELVYEELLELTPPGSALSWQFVLNQGCTEMPGHDEHYLGIKKFLFLMFPLAKGFYTNTAKQIGLISRGFSSNPEIVFC